MSLYLLKISGSNEVENIFEWNGSGSLTAPSGYVFELYTSASVTSYSSSTALELFGGSFAGLFTGELSGSILLNGKTFDEVINETKYGINIKNIPETKVIPIKKTVNISFKNFFDSGVIILPDILLKINGINTVTETRDAIETKIRSGIRKAA